MKMMRYRRAPERPTAQRVEAFTTPSGLGGVFVVSIVTTLNDGRVLVRVHSPEQYPDWDGMQFQRQSEELRPLGAQIIIPLIAGNASAAKPGATP
jgi:hypothetical protein